MPPRYQIGGGRWIQNLTPLSRTLSPDCPAGCENVSTADAIHLILFSVGAGGRLVTLGIHIGEADGCRASGVGSASIPGVLVTALGADRDVVVIGIDIAAAD